MTRVSTYKALIYSTNYTPFGVVLQERDFSSSAYRHGFNGQERDDEVAGPGNSYTAEFWQYDSRLGRRWNIDPIDQISISNYAVFINCPIFFDDPYGNTIDYEKGDGVTGRQHRQMKRDIRHLRRTSINFRNAYNELKNDKSTKYVIKSILYKDLESDGEYTKGEKTIYLSVNNPKYKNEYDRQATAAHEFGHAWRDHHKLDPESPPSAKYPQMPSFQLGESEKDRAKKWKEYHQEWDRIDGERNKSAAEHREKVEIGAVIFQNIVMSDVRRSIPAAYQKIDIDFEYPNVLLAEKFVTVHGNFSYKLVSGSFKVNLPTDYFNKKRSIYEEFGVKLKN